MRILHERKVTKKYPYRRGYLYQIKVKETFLPHFPVFLNQIRTELFTLNGTCPLFTTVVNRPPYRVYIQSAFHMPTPEKEQQERRPLLSINDHFRKIVIVGDDIHRKEDELGVLTVGLLDFLTDKNLLEQG